MNTHDPFNHPQVRKRYPCHAIMIADHPDLDDIRDGHYFFYARNLGGHVQALHESFHNAILIPPAKCELFPALVAPPQVPTAGTVSAADPGEARRRYIEEHNNRCQTPQPAPASCSASADKPGSAARMLSPSTLASPAKPSGDGRPACVPHPQDSPSFYAISPAA